MNIMRITERTIIVIIMKQEITNQVKIIIEEEFNMNKLFVLSYIYIKEIRRSYKFVLFMLFCALIASNAQARNENYSVFAIWVYAIIAIIFGLALVVAIRYRYALKYWPYIYTKIEEAKDTRGRFEVAKYVSDKVDFKK